MEYFGTFAFIMVLFLMGKVSRLERILRDNGLGSVRAAGLGEHYKGNRLVVINKSITPMDSEADLVASGKIGEVFSQIMEI